MSKPIVFFEDQAGGFRYRVVARNGEILVTSEAYTRAADARRGAKDLLARLNFTDDLLED